MGTLDIYFVIFIYKSEVGEFPWQVEFHLQISVWAKLIANL